MRNGLMWLDDDPKKSLETKLGEAATRYRQRLGQAPSVCFVHAPATAAPGETREVRLGTDAAAAPVLVRASRQVPLHCLWLGVADPAEV